MLYRSCLASCAPPLQNMDIFLPLPVPSCPGVTQGLGSDPP